MRRTRRKRSQPQLRLRWAAGEFPLGEGFNVLGREGNITVPAYERSVSRLHAVVEVQPGLVTIRNVGRLGTLVNGKLVEEGKWVPLAPGDKIHLGNEYGFTLTLIEG